MTDTYTPRTDQVRAVYTLDSEAPEATGDAFDRWYVAARNDARRQALLDYADLLDGPTYTMDYGSAEGYRRQLLGLLRRDADLFYGSGPASMDVQP